MEVRLILLGRDAHMGNHHNVWARLNDADYQKLVWLRDKYNDLSYSKVSFADVLRTAINQLYLNETKEDLMEKSL